MCNGTICDNEINARNFDIYTHVLWGAPFVEFKGSGKRSLPLVLLFFLLNANDVTINFSFTAVGLNPLVVRLVVVSLCHVRSR